MWASIIIESPSSNPNNILFVYNSSAHQIPEHNKVFILSSCSTYCTKYCFINLNNANIRYAPLLMWFWPCIIVNMWKLKMPTRCNRGFYWRTYCLLNMFRAPLCPSSGAQEYYTVVAACGISCCGFEVAGLMWSWGLCVRFAGCCSILQITQAATTV